LGLILRIAQINIKNTTKWFIGFYALLAAAMPPVSLAAFPSPSPSFPLLPHQVKLKVPFLCQAPFGNWAQPWQDACEEAAIIIAMHYVNGKPLDKNIGNQEILDLIAFQYQTRGGHHDLTAKQAAQLMRDYYHFTSYELIYNFSVDDIRAALAQGNLVIAPMAGRQLNNRYFRQPGPVYHYVVFIGYDEIKKEFITNDPGTKRGKDFRYKYGNAYQAIHDWNGNKENIASGRKAMLVIKKN
jgi:hypothetical protein